MAEATESKRRSGQIKDGKWLVLAESTNQPDGGWIHSCGTEVLSKEVAHPVWDGPGPCSGGGDVEYQKVPFCPKCENEPGSQGLPITP